MPITIAAPYDPASMPKPDVEIVVKDGDVMQYSNDATKMLEGDRFYVINGDWTGYVYKDSKSRLVMHIDFTGTDYNITPNSTYADSAMQVTMHQAINKHGNFSQLPNGEY